MRVLHVAGNLDAHVGGSTAAAFHTCGYLRAAGVDAVLAGTWERPDSAQYISASWPDLPIHGFSRRFPRHYWNSPDHRRWVTEVVDQFDLVVVHGLFSIPFVEAARAALRHGVACIVQPHGSLDPHDLAKHHNLKRLYGPLVVRPILQGAQKVLVTTRREAERLVGYGARPPIDVVPLPVPPPHVAPDGRRFRERFGITADTPVVLFLSRLDPKKGLERLLPAVASLAAARPNVRVVIAGGTEDRKYEQGLRQQASALHLDGIVTWAGMLLGDAKWDAFAGSDLFVLPSSYENFGIVVVEALLTGTPVVISDEVYVGDDLAGSPAVFVTDSGASSVATALDRALLDVTTDGARFSEAARKAVATFSPELVTQRTIAVYEAALASAVR